MGHIIDEMLSKGIPVIVDESNEDEGIFKYGDLTWDQMDLIQKIRFGFPESFSLDSEILIGNGIDSLIVMAKGEPNGSLDVTVTAGNSDPQLITISLDENGYGEQEFSCDTISTKIIFEHNGVQRVVRAL